MFTVATYKNSVFAIVCFTAINFNIASIAMYVSLSIWQQHSSLLTADNIISVTCYIIKHYTFSESNVCYILQVIWYVMRYITLLLLKQYYNNALPPTLHEDDLAMWDKFAL